MKKLIKNFRKKWPTYLFEVLVLIIGIYGAFALENWNENRKAQTTKKALIENLIEEFKLNLIQLDTVMYYDQLSANTGIYCMELIKTKELPPEGTIDSIFLNLNQLWTYDPSMGALQAAISANEIHLIKNKELIKYLFSWEGLVKDSQENEERFVDHHLQSLPQFYDRIQNANNYSGYEKRMPRSNYHSNYGSLFKDPLFENFLADKILWALDAHRELTAVRARLLKIIELLEKE